MPILEIGCHCRTRMTATRILDDIFVVLLSWNYLKKIKFDLYGLNQKERAEPLSAALLFMLLMSYFLNLMDVIYLRFPDICKKTHSIDPDTGSLIANPPHFEQATLQRGSTPPWSNLSSIIMHRLHLYSYFFIRHLLTEVMPGGRVSAGPWAALASSVDVLHFNVDALPLTHVPPAMLGCQVLNDSEAVGVVGNRIVSQRFDSEFVVMFEQCLFHQSVLPCDLPRSTAQEALHLTCKWRATSLLFMITI